MSEEVLYYLDQLRTGPRDEDAYHSLVELDDSYMPELIEAFYQEKSPKIQALLVEVIWHHRSSEVLPFLRAVLRHHHSNVWKAALDGIVAISHPQGINILADEKVRLQTLNDEAARERLEWIDEAYEQLVLALTNADEDTRHKVVAILANRSNLRSIELLISCLGNTTKDVRDTAVWVLGQLGKPALTELLKALKQDNPVVRQYAASALGQINDPAVIEPLLNALKDEEVAVRREAAYSLSLLADVFQEYRLIEPLSDATNDTNEQVRQWVVDALGKLRAKSAVSILIRLLQTDPNEEIRWFSAIALEQIADEAAIPALINVLINGDESERVRWWAALSLGSFADDQVLKILVKTAKGADSSLRVASIYALGRAKNEKVQPVIIDALNDINSDVRSAAAEVLGRLRVRDSIGKLLNSLQDTSNDVRWSVINALGEIGDPDALPFLQLLQAVDGGKTHLGQSIKEAAEEAIRRIKKNE